MGNCTYCCSNAVSSPKSKQKGKKGKTIKDDQRVDLAIQDSKKSENKYKLVENLKDEEKKNKNIAENDKETIKKKPANRLKQIKETNTIQNKDISENEFTILRPQSQQKDIITKDEGDELYKLKYDDLSRKSVKIKRVNRLRQAKQEKTSMQNKDIIKNEFKILSPESQQKGIIGKNDNNKLSMFKYDDLSRKSVKIKRVNRLRQTKQAKTSMQNDEIKENEFEIPHHKSQQKGIIVKSDDIELQSKDSNSLTDFKFIEINEENLMDMYMNFEISFPEYQNLAEKFDNNPGKSIKIKKHFNQQESDKSKYEDLSRKSVKIKRVNRLRQEKPSTKSLDINPKMENIIQEIKPYEEEKQISQLQLPIIQEDELQNQESQVNPFKAENLKLQKEIEILQNYIKKIEPFREEYFKIQKYIDIVNVEIANIQGTNNKIKQMYQQFQQMFYNKQMFKQMFFQALNIVQDSELKQKQQQLSQEQLLIKQKDESQNKKSQVNLIKEENLKLKKQIEKLQEEVKELEPLKEVNLKLKKFVDFKQVFKKDAHSMGKGELSDNYYILKSRKFDTYFIYDILNQNERHGGFKTQLREIWYLTLNDLIDALYSLMQFQVSSQKFSTGQGGGQNEKWLMEQHQQNFQKFFDYWVEEQGDFFLLLIIEEKLMLLNNYLIELKKFSLQDQKKKIEDICYVFWIQSNQWFFVDQGNLKYYFDQRFDQILIRQNGKIRKTTEVTAIMDIPAYTFRSRNLFQAGSLNQEVKSQITEKKFKHSIFHDLYECLKSLQLDVSILESDNSPPKQYINKQIDKIIKNESRIDKLNYYEKIKPIGKGAFGEVFTIKVKGKEDHEILVWKEQQRENLVQLSATTREISYNLLLDFNDEEIPLIKAVDVFIYKMNDPQKPYMINIIMQKADNELKKIMVANKQMEYFDLFQLFKYVLIGLTRMDLSFLAHRDLKPANILVKNNKYYLADYGEGLNLFYDAKKQHKLFFQVGKWSLKGTPIYMDPILKRLMDKNNQVYYVDQKSWYVDEDLDIFKADIFSFGLILYEVATGKDIHKMNTYKQLSKEFYNNMHHLNLPIQIKQLVLNMIEYEQCNRMNILQLNKYFKEFIQFIKISQQIKCVQYPEENMQFQQSVKFDHIRQDWFEEDVYKGQFNYSYMRLQTQYENTYFIGNQKLDFYDKNNQNNEGIKKIQKQYLSLIKPNYLKPSFQDKQNEMLNKIEKDQLILIKPNYLQSVFQEKISSDECIVLLNNEKRVIKIKMIQTMKFPKYKKDQIVLPACQHLKYLLILMVFHLFTNEIHFHYLILQLQMHDLILMPKQYQSENKQLLLIALFQIYFLHQPKFILIFDSKQI